mmetsp:Transcript_24793/g.37022  ORF Transcript_24793/g.37022 Transcript_24793/m.37022 type:complete len:555 (-) Transcript_24793:1283-2947(-)
MDSANKISKSNVYATVEQDRHGQNAEHQQQQQQDVPDYVIPDSMDTIDVHQMTGSSSKKVLSLQKAMRNKKFILLPGNGSNGGHEPLTLTAEAWDFDRKVRLHNQLKLARRLRSVMESALEEAKVEIKKKGAGAKDSNADGDTHNDDNDSEKWTKMKQKKDAIREIFFKYSDDMLRLASLSNAVLGGYTMDSYDEYIQLHNEQKKEEKEIFESSQKYLNGLRQRMQWECSPATFFSDVKNRHFMMQPAPPPPTADTSPNKPNKPNKATAKATKGPVSLSVMLGVNKQTEKKKGLATKLPKRSYNKKTGNNKNTATPSSKANSQLRSFDFEFKLPHTEIGHGQKKRSSPQSKHAKNANTKSTSAKKSSLDTKKSKSDEAASRSSSSTHKDSSTKSTKKQMDTFSHQLVSKEPVAVAVASKLHRQLSSSSTRSSEEKSRQEVPRTTKLKSSKEHPVQKEKLAKKPKAAKPKMKPPRKCHHCKETTAEYSVCGYWFVSGNRCRKNFCKSCLAIYDMESSEKDDWHCPSCLGICKCAACVKGRERELMRAKKRRRLRG